MRKILIIIILFTFLVNCNQKKAVLEQEKLEYPIPSQIDDWDILIEALIEIESEGNQYAVGKTNDLGILQITPIYVKEVNRILKEDFYFLEDRTDIDKSLEMFEVYQSHHNPSKNIRRAIKIHNPNAGQWYTDKVMISFNRIKKQYETIRYSNYS